MCCRVIRKPFLLWSDEVLCELVNLTLTGFGSQLKETIEEKPEQMMTWVAFVDGEIVGWAIQIMGCGCEHKEAMYYVHPDWRRKGVGTAIMNRMKKDDYPCWVHRWNRTSTLFFNKFKWAKEG